MKKQYLTNNENIKEDFQVYSTFSNQSFVEKIRTIEWSLGYMQKIEKYFEEAKNIKNLISKTLHEKHLIDIYNSNLKFEKDLYKSIKSEYIGSWELQTITKEIIEHKKEQINRFVFKYFPKIIIENNNQQLNSKSKNHQKYIYKKNTRSQKAISASLTATAIPPCA